MKRENLKCLSLLIIPIAFGIWSVLLGQDTNWDLRNYHWYNAYLLLHWRFDIDIAPAGLQTYQSSLFDVPWYMLARQFPAPVVGFIIGAVHSSNLILLYLIGSELLPIEDRNSRDIAALGIAALGMLDVNARALIGTTFNDLIVSIGVLLSLWLALQAIKDNNSKDQIRSAFVAGLPLGITIAGKLTTSPFAVGLAIAFVALPLSLRQRLSMSVAFSAGALVTVVLFLGPWSWWLWHLFGNPVFPFFNDFFHSPWTTLHNDFNPFQHRPGSILEWLLFPFYFTQNPWLVSGLGIIDYRLLEAGAILPALLLLRCVLHSTRLMSGGARYLLLFSAISYVGWMAILPIDRYAVTLDILVPLLIAVSAATFRMPDFTVAVIVAALFPFDMLYHADYGHVPWSRHFVEATLPIIERPEKTLIVLGNKPLGFLAPTLPKQASIVELENDLAPLDDADQLFTRRLREKIAQPWEIIYGIVTSPWTSDKPDPYIGAAKMRFQQVGLTADMPSCRPLDANLSNINPYTVICKMLRSASSQADWPTRLP